MEENRYDYTPEEGFDEMLEEQKRVKKSLLGFRIVVIILAILLAGISALYFSLNYQQQQDYKLLEEDRDSIQSNLKSLIVEYDDLKYQNDTIAAQLQKASDMIEQLKYERRLNYNTIKKYQKEVGTLRTVMKNYLRQIDSLNKLNKQVIGENVTLRKEVSTANLRADIAEERASELQNKVRQGSVLSARGIGIVALNGKDKEISRVKTAVTLRIDFTVAANTLAATGNRVIYLRLISPEGYLLTTEAMPTFLYNGEKTGYSASREIDYQNENLEVSIFYANNAMVKGTYRMEIYCEGKLIGSTEQVFK